MENPAISNPAGVTDFTDPIAPWFEQPIFDESKAENDAALLRLARDYRRDGFVIHDFGFGDNLLAECLEATNRIPPNATRQQDLWRRHESVKKLAAHPAIIDLLSRLYQRSAFAFQTLNFRRGSQQATHSDTFFFSSFPERFMCGVWIALEDVDLENGPLHYYPGSHQLPVYTSDQVAVSQEPVYTDFVAARMREYGLEKALGVIKRGEAVIWSANLFHGGEPIHDKSRSRFSQVNHYYFDGCAYLTPFHSSLAHRKTIYREPFDIGRGRFVRSSIGQRTIWPSLPTAIKGRLRNTFKLCPASE